MDEEIFLKIFVAVLDGFAVFCTFAELKIKIKDYRDLNRIEHKRFVEESCYANRNDPEIYYYFVKTLSLHCAGF